LRRAGSALSLGGLDSRFYALGVGRGFATDALWRCL
jgi:hypothetical protein